LRLRRLFDASLNGDEKAEKELWEVVLLCVYELACKFCRQYGTSNPDIDDIVQDVILKIYRLRSEKILAVRRSWCDFLRTVVRSCAINQYYRRGRIAHHEVPLNPIGTDGEESGKSLYLIIPDDEEDPAAQAIAREQNETAKQILATLPKERAEIFGLYLEGYLYREIAEMFSMPDKTVATIIHRTKHLIAGQLNSKE